MRQQSYSSVKQNLTTGSLSCRELVDSFLTRIEETRDSNWFVEVYAEEARVRAAEIDSKLASGQAGKLAGLVIGVKDVIAHEGHGLQASSRILAGFQSQFTATALQRLIDEDAIVIGRQSCDEFAMGSSNEHSVYGPAANPVDPSRVPGGSSGASAAAVAAGCCHASLGSDTGGSVRQPASFCGVVGMKPTYGRISRWGLIAYASSFDQIGPIAHSIEDIELMLEVMCGPDERDHTMNPEQGPFVPSEAADGPLRIGVLTESLESPGLDPLIKNRISEVLDNLRKAGHDIVEFSFPLLEAMVPCYYILTTAEASSNLNRFDGVHYGRRAPRAETPGDVYEQSRTEGFGQEVQKRIMLGSFVLSEGYVDAYFTHAQKIRRKIAEETMNMFERCDVLISPTSPTVAFRQGEKLDDPVTMYLSDIYTVHANLAGIPAISVPVGTDDEGLPFGLQIMGKPWMESSLLSMTRKIGAVDNQKW